MNCATVKDVIDRAEKCMYSKMLVREESESAVTVHGLLYHTKFLYHTCCS